MRDAPTASASRTSTSTAVAPSVAAARAKGKGRRGSGRDEDAMSSDDSEGDLLDGSIDAEVIFFSSSLVERVGADKLAGLRGPHDGQRRKRRG